MQPTDEDEIAKIIKKLGNKKSPGHDNIKSDLINAAVNGHLELTLLKDRQRFDAVSTSNLEVYKFWDW